MSGTETLGRTEKGQAGRGDVSRSLCILEMRGGRVLINSGTAPFLSGRVTANSSGFQRQCRLLIDLLNIFHPGFTERYVV